MGEVERILHYKDLLMCDHLCVVNLDPTEERKTEIKDDLRVLTNKDLRELVTIDCPSGCTKIVEITTGLAKDYELTGGAIPVLRNLIGITDKHVKVQCYTLDADAAAVGLTRRKKPRPPAPDEPHQCAKYVREALNDGGLPVGGLGNANVMGPKISHYGFTEVPANNYSPQTGDIAWFPPNAVSEIGHVTMWNGREWISDYRQPNGMSPYTGKLPNAPYTIYRSNYRSGSAGHQAYAQPK
jgi:hypothetical protein